MAHITPGKLNAPISSDSILMLGKSVFVEKSVNYCSIAMPFVCLKTMLTYSKVVTYFTNSFLKSQVP